MDRLLAMCSKSGLALMVHLRVEDAHGQHPALQVPDVGIVEVLDIIERRKEVPVILCGAYSLSQAQSLVAGCIRGQCRRREYRGEDRPAVRDLYRDVFHGESGHLKVRREYLEPSL